MRDRYSPPHPVVSRREVIQAGAIGVMGLSLGDVAALRGQAAAAGIDMAAPRSVIFVFLSGGAPQHDTFDPKPDAPDSIRGEFRPIATRTPGIHICEHLPRLAQRSDKWALVRSLSHTNNGHDQGTLIMLTGRSEMRPGRGRGPQPTDWPAMASVASYATRSRNGLPPAVVLPEKIVHSNAGIFPGQFGGVMGSRYDPWFIEATTHPHAYHSFSGAYPGYLFNLHRGDKADRDDFEYRVAHLSLPEGMSGTRLTDRVSLLREIDRQRRGLDELAQLAGANRFQQGALALLSNPRVRWAFDVTSADMRTQDRYGANSFGWSLLMARRLVEAGVNMVQVNLGNMGSWDLHGNAFPMLKDFLLPPMDRGVSALLDDLEQSGLLETTLVVMAGEFGRTPQIFNGAPHVYRTVGRGHWGPVQTALFAGCGVRGGNVVGSSDRVGAVPASAPQTPENFAATIYNALGIPSSAHWHDAENRPHAIYHAEPIRGLIG